MFANGAANNTTPDKHLINQYHDDVFNCGLTCYMSFLESQEKITLTLTTHKLVDLQRLQKLKKSISSNDIKNMTHFPCIW